MHSRMEDEERALLAAFERDEFASVANRAELARIKAAARATVRAAASAGGGFQALSAGALTLFRGSERSSKLIAAGA